MLKWFGNYTELSDEQLMALIASGKTAAIKELYNRYNEKLLYYLYRMMGSNEDKAQDLLQDVFLKIIDKSFRLSFPGYQNRQCSYFYQTHASCDTSISCGLNSFNFAARFLVI